ncbi:asparagine synthase C-terminal domain-containing protein [Nitrososphaera sp.]|uniref:asparagine synthase-related protein n=1 Tax=Nitrososphaera sp. TaxID=1971748 RepID=UPI0017E56BD2|nr:asparagine synthase C-terminal domain-containing protein [Nitrososphaera sp.]NWG36454.1 asparagine synthase [Nitrososphaera sp.]
MLTDADKKEITNILTLRYSPVPLSNDAKTWQDFIPKNNVTIDGASRTVHEMLSGSFAGMNKLGLTVSGGIDSSVLLHSASKSVENLVTFSVLVDGKKDPMLERMIANYETDHHDIVLDRIFKEMPRHIWLVQKPMWNMWSYYLLKYASKYCDILCTGDGGDELFGGYTFRYQQFLNGNLASPIDRVKSYLDGHGRDWVPDQKDLFGKSINFDWDSVYSLLVPYFDNPLEPLDQVFLADFNGKLLHDWHPMFQRWADAFNLKLFRPFLSKEMISFALRIPVSLKYDRNSSKGKLILRHLLASYGLQELSAQGKQGFAFDTIKLWQKEGKEIFENIMDQSEVVEAGLISMEWIDRTLGSQERQASHRYVNKLLGILALEVWHRIFITKSMSLNQTL